MHYLCTDSDASPLKNDLIWKYCFQSFPYDAFLKSLSGKLKNKLYVKLPVWRETQTSLIEYLPILDAFRWKCGYGKCKFFKIVNNIHFEPKSGFLIPKWQAPWVDQYASKKPLLNKNWKSFTITIAFKITLSKRRGLMQRRNTILEQKPDSLNSPLCCDCGIGIYCVVLITLWII